MKDDVVAKSLSSEQPPGELTGKELLDFPTRRRALPSTTMPLSLWQRGHHAGQASLYVRYPQDLKTVVERQLAAQYPNAKQERLPDDSLG